MISRNNTFKNDIIFIDGMPKVGKAALGPLLSVGNNIEKQKVDENFEYICILNYLNLLSENDSATMLKLYSDLATYKSYISREINLRYHDITGVFKSPKKFKNIKNLFKKDNSNIVSEIIKFKPKLNIISHNIFSVSKPLLTAFGERLKIILVVRNPVYIMKEWSLYLSMFGVDPKELTIALGKNGECPWYVKNIDEYNKLSSFDKVIYSLKSLTFLQEKNENNNQFNDINLLVIPFESFLLDSNKWINKLSHFLNIDNSKALMNYLPKIGCPRNHLLNEKENKYSKLTNNDLIKKEKKYFQKCLEEIKINSSEYYYEEFLKILKKYTVKYKFKRQMPWDNCIEISD